MNGFNQNEPPVQELSGDEIAIIGMSCRFPDASNVETFWKNIRDGVNAVRHFNESELRQRGVPHSLLENPNFVKAASFLDEPGMFDAEFFGMSHREAEITDPQHRVLLECAWTALEDAGYDPDRFAGAISVFAGATINSYLLYNLAANPETIADLDPVQINIGNASDFLATRIAYKLNLKGPCYSVQSACSTSLVAVHAACESLLNEECDMALAGGVSVNVSFRNGYLYLDGGMVSPDGYCRPFDARAKGTIFGSGAGVVVLKRLEDAIRDRDTVHALIKGSAANNDGSLKAGYTAPGVEGQRRVIAEALANADVDARSIGYIEAHGTATPLGDPIEIQALTQAFGRDTDDRGYCGIGSVKSNIGHLDAASGVAGLIKTAMALKNRQLPPSLHFQNPNPNIDFAATPFRVNAALRDWPAVNGPRRAGVSAFGVGGTNAHVILEEAPRQGSETPENHAPRLLILSAKTEPARQSMAENLAGHLKNGTGLDLADIAFTLQMGRKPFQHRLFTIANDPSDAARALTDETRVLKGSRPADGKKRPVVFLFPGQGAQYAGMGADLYQREPVFREEIDRCAEILLPELGSDLRKILFPKPGDEASANTRLCRTDMAQPALFVTCHALARLYLTRGIEPKSMAGHSIGEYVAACLSGVFSLEDGLKLIAARARLMAELPEGAMIALPFSEQEAAPFLNPDLALAAINGPRRCVVSGPLDAVADLEKLMTSEGVSFRRLVTSHAFHSPMLEPMLDPFLARASRIQFKPPTIPFLSNLTGTWITPEQATDPKYWADHARSTVRFSDNLDVLLADPAHVYLELGPGGVLGGLVRQHTACLPETTIIQTLAGPRGERDDVKYTLTAHGRLWLAGVDLDWSKLYEKKPRRIPLPTYAFDRRLYWVEPKAKVTAEPKTRDSGQKRPIDQWFYMPVWQRVPPPALDPEQIGGETNWLVFAHAEFFSDRLERRLTKQNQKHVLVRTGSQYHRDGHVFSIDPTDPNHYQKLIAELATEGLLPDAIIHAWLFTGEGNPGADPLARYLAHGYYSLLYLARALDRSNEPHSCNLLVAGDRLLAMTAGEEHEPEKAPVLGLCKVLPREYPGLRCQVADLARNILVDPVLAMAFYPAERPVAFRAGQCWAQSYQPLSLPVGGSRIRDNGVYLFTGGLVEMGYEIARYLARNREVRLVFLEEKGFPEPEQWGRYLVDSDDKDPIAAGIRHIRDLMEMNAEVLVLPTDLADEHSVRDAVERAVERHGSVHGLIHNAKARGEHALCPVGETDTAETDRHFIPRVYALQHLIHSLDALNPAGALDFALLNASLSSVLGGAGMAAYASANACVDQFARWLNRRDHGVWISVNWDAWQQAEITESGSYLTRRSIAPEQVRETLDRIFSRGDIEQIAVSVTDLEPRFAVLETARVETTGREQARHPRPNLPYAYVTPTGKWEPRLAEIWESALGIDRIGALDNFFDLGGDSLLAVKTISRLKQSLDMEIPVTSMYEGLTVRALAGLIEEWTDNQTGEKQDKQQADRGERMDRRRQIQMSQRNRRRGRAAVPGDA